MARRGRKYGPMGGLKRLGSTYQRKATVEATKGMYTLLFGEKPTKSKKNSS